MADEKFGIENLKAVLKFGVTLGKNISDDLADKKLSFGEVLGLAAQLGQISDFVANKDAIIAEAKDLSFDEIKELVAEVEQVITNEEVVATIEDAIAVIIAAKNLIERFTAKKGTVGSGTATATNTDGTSK